MEMSKPEILVVQQATEEKREFDLRQLTDSQLALVGGGIGDTIL